MLIPVRYQCTPVYSCWIGPK